MGTGDQQQLCFPKAPPWQIVTEASGLHLNDEKINI